MIALFFGSMAAGHVYVIAIVTAVQIITFKEVIAIANVPSREKKLQFTKSLNWYFLATTMYFLYGESVIYYFKHIVVVDAFLLPFATHHRFISFILYIIGLQPPYSLRMSDIDCLKDLFSSWLRSRKDTTNSSLRSLHGLTWPYTSLSCRLISS